MVARRNHEASGFPARKESPRYFGATSTALLSPLSIGV